MIFSSLGSKGSPILILNWNSWPKYPWGKNWFPLPAIIGGKSLISFSCSKPLFPSPASFCSYFTLFFFWPMFSLLPWEHLPTHSASRPSSESKLCIATNTQEAPQRVSPLSSPGARCPLLLWVHRIAFSKTLEFLRSHRVLWNFSSNIRFCVFILSYSCLPRVRILHKVWSLGNRSE